MTKLTISLLSIGIFGLTGLFCYTQINLSKIVPLFILLSFFLHSLLGGILSYISKEVEENKTKIITFLFLIVSFIFSVIKLDFILQFETVIKIQFALIISSFMIIIRTMLSGTFKTLFLISFIFPALILLGIHNKSTFVIGTITLALIMLYSIYRIFLVKNEKRS